jgi:hypothetical protein
MKYMKYIVLNYTVTFEDLCSPGLDDVLLA